MARIFSQMLRQLNITTALGPERLYAESFAGVEELGRPFRYEIEVLSEQDDFEFDELLGTLARVTLHLTESLAGPTRLFSGVVTRVKHLGHDAQGLSRYWLLLEPWVAVLRNTADCRIFQDMTIPEILSQVFGDLGFEDFRFELTGEYEVKDYCVQYRESSFDFVHRLMEYEGIYYFWKHEEERHEMLICDDMRAHTPAEGFEEVVYRSPGAGAWKEGYLQSWTSSKELTPGASALNSFNFLSPTPAPNERLLSRDVFEHDHLHGGLEVYDNQGGYDAQAQGERYARIRREELQCFSETFEAEGDVRGLACGGIFTPVDLPFAKKSGREFLITRTEIECSIGTYGTGTGEGEQSFFIKLAGIPVSERPYRPPRVTEKPFVKGPQTALVTGPSSEEIYVDDHARVKVQFHWDRQGIYDEGTSCWVRVSQPWAGTTYGGLAIPRIGQEVIIDFLEGDPDRPIMTGRVYNGDSMPIVSNAGREESPARKSRDKARKKKEERKKKKQSKAKEK